MSKYFKSLTVTFGILFCFSTMLKAQFEPSAVEKSDQKIIYQGKLYYIHTVSHGQTLYSICRVYEVNENAVREANPGVSFNPLSIGQVLRIPAQEGTETTEPDNSAETPGNDDLIYHTVLPKQTPYFLHKKYNVPLEIIYYYNPGSENGLQIGQVVKIPKQKQLQNLADQDFSLQENVLRYEVKPGDTLYRIALMYGISVSDLVNANESLRWGLKAGQIIIIPTLQTAALMASRNLQDSILLITALAGYTLEQCDSIRMQKRMRPPIKIALLLPFFAREGLELDTLQFDADSVPGEITKTRVKPFKGRGAAEFFEGFLLAVDSLKRTGLNISLFVYDTEGDTIRVEKILNELDIVEPDLIIGPFYADNVRKTSKYAFEHKIPFIPPLMKDDSLIKKNPYLFQVVPSHESELVAQVKYLSQMYADNLLLFYKPNSKTRGEVSHYKQLLTNHLLSQPGFDTLRLISILINDSLTINTNKSLVKSRENYAIVLSDYEPDVINTLTQLHFDLREYPIKIFGQPSWQVFPNIRIDHFHDLQATIYSPFYIDYTSPQVKRFVYQCRNRLQYEPFKTASKGTGLNYTFLGYDVGMYFITSINYYGEDVCNCASSYSPELLLSKYHFVRNSSLGCFENIHLNFIRYTKEFEVVREYPEGNP
jgi:LysM repeat protein